VAETLLLIRLGDAADVLLEGVQAQGGVGVDEALLGEAEAGIELAGELPGEGIEEGDELAHLAAGGDGLAHAEMSEIDDAGLGDDAAAVGDVAADDDGLGVEGLGELEGAGAGGMEALRQAQMIEGVEAVGAAHGAEAGRGQAAAEHFSRGLAHPLQAGLAGAVVEGQHEQDAAGGSLR